MSCSGLNLIALKIRTICSTSLLTCERARSSASVVDLVTAFYLVACYTISLLNKLIKKPYKLRYIRVLSVKLVLDVAFRTWFILYGVIVENLRARYLVL
jgi:hypothetical protein